MISFPKTRTNRVLLVAGIFIMLLAAVLAIFYAVENWRGERAWEKCKRELEARGEVTDWRKLTPPPVSDDDNFFTAPKMAGWFQKPTNGVMTNELTEKLKFQNFAGAFPDACALTLARVTVLPSGGQSDSASEKADLETRYISPDVFWPWNRLPETNGSATNVELSIIFFADAPLETCVENLARRAGIHCTYDTNYFPPPRPYPDVSLRWEKVPAMDAMRALLNYNGLQLVPEAVSNSFLITKKSSPVFSAPEVSAPLKKLLAARLGKFAIGAQGPLLLAGALQNFLPLQISCHADAELIETNLAQLFADAFPSVERPPQFHVEREGANDFRITLDAAAAADYLKWNDQFASDFNLIDTALQRPFARMDGNDSSFFVAPIPNYVCVRVVAQTLAQKTQSYLLLGQPEKALSEITLLHDLPRLLEGAPTGQPMTLVATMINGAVTGLYVDALADGMRLHAWRGPDLATLQSQLKAINLLPFMTSAFQNETAGNATFMEDLLTTGENIPESVKRHKDSFIPKGWFYQNLVTLAQWNEEYLQGISSKEGRIYPEKIDEIENKVNAITGFHPRTFFAAKVTPNFSPAFQVVASAQTKVSQGRIACALERFHLANGNYPETLDALVPQFIETIPHDIIGGLPLRYRRLESGTFLLYSVGWDEVDDGGKMLKDQNGFEGRFQGDWVWKN